jgi:sucrose phosphorylase
VLLNIADLLLFYVSQGADLIRMDAIGYLWKEIGTNCIHLPQTHAIVQILRELIDQCASNTVLVTETNVPHRDNISYFGDGHNEAQMVYQFPLVPLMLNAIYSGSARHLSEWASGLEKMSDTTTFFNFLASHDGIGVVPAKGILNETELNQLVEQTLAHGGKVSYKNNSDGSQSPYELNITFFEALSDPNATEPHDLQIKRFLVTQAIMLALQGVPGIYLHSLLGSHNWLEGLAQTKRNRTINRQKFQIDELEQRLSDPTSHTAQVFDGCARLIRQRINQPAFHPNATQTILTLPEADALFVLLRSSTNPAKPEQILAIHNLAATTQTCQADLTQLNLTNPHAPLTDLISNQNYQPDANSLLHLEIEPYQVLWLHN